MLASRLPQIGHLGKSLVKSLSSLSHNMSLQKIVPDVVAKAPSTLCQVKYPSGVIASEGNVLTPTVVKDVPEVKWPADPTSFYTLLMTDPDAPDMREWHHWLVGNIPGNDIARGTTLSEYVGSGPPPGSGLHRYVFLVFKQQKNESFDEKRLTNTSANDRAHFSTMKFAEKYGLGDAVAGNFYLAEYDDYVPILYKQLGA